MGMHLTVMYWKINFKINSNAFTNAVNAKLRNINNNTFIEKK